MLLALSDPVWNALIAALLAVVLKWMDYRSQKRSEKVSEEVTKTKEETAGQLKKVADNVQKIETATNSMKDQLVLATKDAATLQGRADERAEQEAKGGPIAPASIAESVETLKGDVKEVKRDVKAVKKEVIKED